MIFTGAVKGNSEAQWVVDSDRHARTELLVEPVQYGQSYCRAHHFTTVITAHPSHTVVVEAIVVVVVVVHRVQEKNKPTCFVISSTKLSI